MSDHRDEHLDLCAGYALGALDADDRQRLEAHLAEGCPTCEAALADFGAGTVALARSLDPAKPSAALRQRVLDAARAESQGAAAPASAATPSPSRGRVLEMKPRRVPAFQWVWAAAAAAFAITSGVLWNQAETLKAELNANQTAMADLQQKIAGDQQLLQVLGAPGVKFAEMQITPDGVAELKARATYDPQTKSAVLSFDNFTAPTGHDYELWALNSDGALSLGVIRVDEHGHAVVRLDNVGNPDTLAGFAVSLEAVGGSTEKTKPHGPVVMAGKFAG